MVWPSFLRISCFTGRRGDLTTAKNVRQPQRMILNDVDLPQDRLYCNGETQSTMRGRVTVGSGGVRHCKTSILIIEPPVSCGVRILLHAQ